MIICISGPSAAGKDFVFNQISKQYDVSFLQSHTTRAPRDGEVNGDKYVFVSDSEFDEIYKDNGFAEVVEYSGTKYGISNENIEKAAESGKPCIFIGTPLGVDDIEKVAGKENIFRVYITCDEGTRFKRYIDRVGAHNVSAKDIEKAYDRLKEDNIIFKGYEDKADLIIDNSFDYRYEKNPEKYDELTKIASRIIEEATKEKDEEEITL